MNALFEIPISHTPIPASDILFTQVNALKEIKQPVF